MFFTPCDNWKTLSSVNVCRSFEIFSTVILLLSLKQVFWQKSVFYVISTITMRYQYQSSKRMLSFTICTWQTFCRNMGGRLPNSCFMKTFLLSFIFWLFYNFLYKWIFWNTKTLWKHVFHNCIFKNSLVFIRWVFIK